MKEGLSHLCSELCRNKLPCDHECGMMCHKGECEPCHQVTSNIRVYCACGESFIEPPVKCGNPPPVCMRKCEKMMPCGHSCQKFCHFGDCTKCSVMIEVRCQCGRHQVLVKCCERNNKNKCREVCGVEMPCRHKCPVICHEHFKDNSDQCKSKCFK